MILEMAGSTLTSYRPLFSHGTSDIARFVAEQAEQGHRQLKDSFTFGLGGKGAFGELGEIYEECLEPNWDGYNALPVTEDAYQAAYRFLEALPLSIPLPSFGAEPDGHITMEWYCSPRRTLSVSVSPDGDLHYAALLGDGSAYGTEPFFGEAPKAIVDLIQRVMAA